jgi:hypothetical protein
MKWFEKVERFCAEYNIPLEYLAETLYEPKVIPMIRGKAFEFTTMLALQDILPQVEFEVFKTPANTQLGDHDQDVSVTHKPTSVTLSVECKLAAKGKFKRLKDGQTEIRIKCMRSRTLGAEMVTRLSDEWGVSEDLLSVHNDQYLPGDFDVVVTSIGNAFYTTDRQGRFKFAPNKQGREFLRFVCDCRDEELQEAAFDQLYIAATADLAVSEENGVVCTRKKCAAPDRCGFIPNYPLLTFPPRSRTPALPWRPLDDAAVLFRQIARQESAP